MSKLVFPDAALEQHVIALGKTGSGKSSALRGVVEHLLDQGKRVCIIDPKGDWWGLRASADGKSAGYPVVIFGGAHKDVDLNQHAGQAVAELVATGNRPCIIDLGGWMVGERTRFWIDFASTIFRTIVGEQLYLIIDEVHNFAPQGKVYDPDAGKMLHWTNRLASEGRGKGITLLAASQRPQKVHKDFITSAETLIAMRVIHARDREAFEEWIDGCGDPKLGKEMLGTLANMKRGEGWVWSPEIGFGPKRVTFPMFKTFDSFKPQRGATVDALPGWAGVDLEQVTAKLAALVEETKANDPSLLKARIRELERARGAVVSSEDQKALEADRDRWKRECHEARSEATRLFRALQSTRDRARAAAERIVADANWAEQWHPFEELDAPRSAEPKPEPMPVVKRERPMPLRVASNGSRAETGLSGPEQRILDSIAWLESIGVAQPEQTAVAFMAGYTIGGGAFNNPRGRLNQNGLVRYCAGERIELTDDGRRLARVPDQALTVEQLHARIMDRLPGPERRILQPLLDAYPHAVTNEKLATLAGYSEGGGAYNNPRGRLRSLGLIDYEGGKVKARPILFLEG